jgi:hypothetical protein
MECANSRLAMEYQRSRFPTGNSGGSDARNRGEHLVMPRRRRNLERQVAGTAPLVRVAGGYLEFAPGIAPALAGVPLHPSPAAGCSGAVETPRGGRPCAT